MDSLDRDQILHHCLHSRHRGPLTNSHGAFEDFNPICGDRVRIEVRLTAKDAAANPDVTVAQARFDGEGCAISQAVSSMLCELAEGQPAEGVAGWSAGT